MSKIKKSLKNILLYSAIPVLILGATTYYFYSRWQGADEDSKMWKNFYFSDQK